MVVALAVGTGIWWFFFRGPSSADCAPVREMLSFNKTQIDAMNAKTHDPAPGSYEAATEPSDLDYQAWADGLTDRAAKVTAKDLAGPAGDAARTARWLVDARQNAMREDGKLLRGAGRLTGDDAVKAAETLVTNFTNFPALFPQGSIVSDSKALPSIWEHWDTFTGLFASVQGPSGASANSIFAAKPFAHCVSLTDGRA